MIVRSATMADTPGTPASDNNADDGDELSRLGKFIRTQRQLAELSQRELAKLTSLSDPYVSQIERGLHQPSIRVLKAIATALNVRADTMLAYAGLLEYPRGEDERRSPEALIMADPRLTEDQRHAVLSVYRGFLASTGNTANEQAS